MKPFPINRLPALLGFAFLFAFSPLVSAQTLNVVASFSILGDMVKQVGGERVGVHTLVGPGGDAHVYQPTPSDARTIAQARLVFVNGLGFEGWIDRLIKSSGYRGPVIQTSAGINPLDLSRQLDSDHQHDGKTDPHGWQDLTNALRYVDNIAKALGEADPAGKGLYQANADRYKKQLSALDTAIHQEIGAIPQERRKVVTSHDAFGYFARAYGIRFIAPVGVNTEAEPSAADIGRIIKQIRREKIPAVFLESVSDPRLLERIRQESGAKIGGTLYSDSLSKAGGPAASYLEMMRYNAQTLTTALTRQN